MTRPYPCIFSERDDLVNETPLNGMWDGSLHARGDAAPAVYHCYLEISVCSDELQASCGRCRPHNNRCS